MECLRKQANKIPVLQRLEDLTKIDKTYILLGACLFCVAIIMATPFGPIVTSTIGIVIPLQETLVILKQVNPKRDEIKHMLVFWMVFGILTSLDAYSGPILRFVPLWYTIKFFFVLWAGPLRFKAGLVLYDNILIRIPEHWYTGQCGIESAVRKATDAVKTVAENEFKKKDAEDAKKVD
ncbi:membrane traffic protein [Ordospora colligata]|uniref:Membrane traffic protein n=1 Tax=Ordospora colligata OC4 TaxID=1354746 RepID=A0A0B2UD61_9MICR|nr:membrane traffic protein [Ordospora colligata OC4]KHN69011.1 membrane traffic protein [Ordospora colligata OC4]TBU14239.1 membrane traffic protein [Ordospora colligata]TBU14286.1 membrane traffic protein [Ordospora colligata]TBU17916.1 membrane traffic protein [Ordospora colligata]